ncbi:hypothetical protein JRQ81_015280 [Phrynocephalus forsythii]|uniref:Uncharacterized protein n=1 Tax=Phrynocephalus forsythii TaxID=171643 RepID=A0A9Q1B1A3_9SAUR|nr:hypothetical protein JRQ81_015280 [Phrynocephalus forsythii]
MRWVSGVASLAVFSIQLCFLAQVGGGLAGKELVDDNALRDSAARRALHPSLEGGKERETRRPHSPRWPKAEKAAGAGGRAQSNVMRKAVLGTRKEKASGKIQVPPLSPSKTRSQGLQTHLDGHGEFNMDMSSCPGIQLKTCRKPSDCDGCLGLYTCKLPRGKCDLKAVSRQTGSFFRSIQNS